MYISLFNSFVKFRAKIKCIAEISTKGRGLLFIGPLYSLYIDFKAVYSYITCIYSNVYSLSLIESVIFKCVRTVPYLKGTLTLKNMPFKMNIYVK